MAIRFADTMKSEEEATSKLMIFTTLKEITVCQITW